MRKIKSLLRLLRSYLYLKKSKQFDPRYYLAANPDVRKADVDPLWHYVRHGCREGRAMAPQSANNEKSTQVLTAAERVDVYVSCWLVNKESIHTLLNQFYQLMYVNGFNVRFITNSPVLEQHHGDVCIRESLHLLQRPIAPSAIKSVPENLYKELVALSSAWERPATDTNKLRSHIAGSYQYWKKVLIENSPSLFIVWGSSCMLSRLHISLCQELNIPFIVMERGHFPGTLCVDLQGQFYFGSRQLPLALPPHDTELLASIRRWVASIDEVAYSNMNAKDKGFESLEKSKHSGRKCVLFIGVNDKGSSIALRSKNISESHGVEFINSLAACQVLQEALQLVDQRALLVVKPHPSDTASFERLANDNTVIMSGYNINELIKKADLCVTLSTTSLAMCAIESVPVLTLSLTDMSGYHAAYESIRRSDLIVQLRNALERKDFDIKQKNAERWLQDLFLNRLYGFESDHQLSSIRDLSSYISSRIYAKRYQTLMLAHSAESPITPCGYRRFTLEKSILESRDLQRPEVDIIIPIYGGYDVTKACLDAALDLSSADCRVVAVNDASPEPEIVELLNGYSEKHPKYRFVLINNPINLGFVGSVNRGMEFSKDRDVVLLNSDAFISKNSIDKLRDLAYAHPRIATVTPFSNNASIFSIAYPVHNELDLENAEIYVDQTDNLLQTKNSNIGVEVPVGHGFCLFIRRSALNQVGYFDEMTFGKGYSEEVDFCLRARKLGLMNLAAPGVFVGHVGGVSFGDSADSLRLANRKILAERYPEYFGEVSQFAASDPLADYRVM